MISRSSLPLLALALASGSLGAQQPTIMPEVEVRTFTLRHLRPENAVKAVEPYIVSPNGGVFGPSDSFMRAITVRETPRALARIDSVLDALDQPPATVRLRFQLIAAQDEAARDPRIASLDSTLRDLFRFQGYRLLAQTVVSVSEWNSFSQTFIAEGDRLLLEGRVTTVSADGEAGRVALDVALSRPHVSAIVAAQQGVAVGNQILSTGLSIPLGQTVVLGSGVSGESIQALILVVTPEIPEARED